MRTEIAFDISQTGAEKAGCGYLAHAMTQAMLELAPEHRYLLPTGFGDLYFDSPKRARCPYAGRHVHHGPRHRSREEARTLWNGADAETSMGMPGIDRSSNFWCPVQFREYRFVYTLYEMGFVVDPAWTSESNRVGCFEGVFRSAIAADWVVAISRFSRDHFLQVFAHFHEERVRVIYPCSQFRDLAVENRRPKSAEGLAAGPFWLSVGTIEPKKNQRMLAESFASLGRRTDSAGARGQNGLADGEFLAAARPPGI